MPKAIKITKEKYWISVNINGFEVEFLIKKPQKSDILKLNKEYAKKDGDDADRALIKKFVLDWRPEEAFIDENDKPIQKDNLDSVIDDIGVFNALVGVLLNANVVEIESELKNS